MSLVYTLVLSTIKNPIQWIPRLPAIVKGHSTLELEICVRLLSAIKHQDEGPKGFYASTAVP